MVLVFGAIGYVMRLVGMSPTLFVIALVLGSMMEALTASQPVPPLPASRARTVCERTSRRQVQAAVVLVVVTAGAVTAGLLTG